MSIKKPEHWLNAEDGTPLGILPTEGEMTISCDGGCDREATLLLPEGWTLAVKPQILSLVRFFCPTCRQTLRG